MRAMVLTRIGPVTETTEPLEPTTVSNPIPRAGEILVEVSTCGVCHTELDEIEGRTPPPELPIVPGHQVVGTVVQLGPSAERFQLGDRVGVAWIFSACGTCTFCKSGRENLCHAFMGTGRDAHGGYAELMTVAEAFAYHIPTTFSDAEAAPLLCAGAIGYRSLALSGITNGRPLGLTGFGASAHLVLHMSRYLYPDTKVVVFARSTSEQAFARELGAYWAGGTEDVPPFPVASLIDTTPVWRPVVEGMKHLERGGRLIINAIRKEEADKDALLALRYHDQLWYEKEIKSVANVTRNDVVSFLKLAADIPIRPSVQRYPLEQANIALKELKTQKIRGAKVLEIRRPS